jgi:hypothetical protein
MSRSFPESIKKHDLTIVIWFSFKYVFVEHKNGCSAKSILVYSLIAVRNEPLETGVSNFVWRHVISIPTNCVRNFFYILTIENVTTVQTFQVIDVADES